MTTKSGAIRTPWTYRHLLLSCFTIFGYHPCFVFIAYIHRARILLRLCLPQMYINVYIYMEYVIRARHLRICTRPGITRRNTREQVFSSWRYEAEHNKGMRERKCSSSVGRRGDEGHQPEQGVTCLLAARSGLDEKSIVVRASPRALCILQYTSSIQCI